MTHHDDLPAPRDAAEAAQRLAYQGKHVHLVSDGESVSISGECL